MAKINVSIIDEENGLKTYSEVQAVRVVTKDYRLLIMDDYAPVIGQIEGDVSFLLANEEVSLKGIKAYYKHEHNNFVLLLERRSVQ